MNANRLLGEGKSFYHVISRTVDRSFVFHGAEEKEVCKKIMRRLEKLLGVRLVIYCLMSNHFHLLLEVPDRDELPRLTEDQLLELLPTLYDDTYVLIVKQDLERAHALNCEVERERRIAEILDILQETDLPEHPAGSFDDIYGGEMGL